MLQVLTNVLILVSPLVWFVRFRKIRRYLPTLMLFATLTNVSALALYESLPIHDDHLILGKKVRT